MIYGIGIDSIEVARLGKSLGAEKGLKEKLFTSREIEYCDSKRKGVRNYAARFAAKEAFFKALGTGWRGGLAFTDIEVVNDELGKPEIVLHGKAKEEVVARDITNVQVSLTHLEDIASAIVLLEK